MKKIIAIAFATIIAGLAISCQKEAPLSENTTDVQYTFNITVNDQVGFDSDASTKGGLPPSYKTEWDSEDKIFLFFKPTGGSLLEDTYATLTYNGSSWRGDVIGSTSLGEAGTLSAVYVYKLDGSVTPAYTDSKWTIATGNTFYNCQTEVNYTVSANVISASLDLKAPADFVCFSISGTSGDALTCNQVKGWKDVAIGSEMTFSNVTCTGYMTGFDNIRNSSYKDYYGRIVSGETSLNGKACNFSVVKNGKVYEYTATPKTDKRSFKMSTSATGDFAWTEAPGKLPGLFTVGKGADGKAGTEDDVQVRFSQGNLWYGKVNDEAETATFNFEANQYSFASSWDANHVSHFYWSKTASVAYAEGYNDGSASDSDVFFTNATETTAKTDFEVNGQTNVWRTLSLGEWQYLLDSRTVNGGTKAGKSYSLNITYSTISGLVLYPDDYTGSALSGTVESLPEGVVFLPQASRREGSSFIQFGFYWSSSPADNVTKASYIVFNSSFIGAAAQKGSRKWGMSVRLVSKID